MSLFCLNFLDKAIERGDDIVLATKPDPTKNLCPVQPSKHKTHLKYR